MILVTPDEHAAPPTIAYTDPDLIVVDHDFETFCRLSIFTVGGWRYAQDESCEPLMLSWGVEPDDIKTWLPLYQKNGQLRLRALPKGFIDHIRDPRVMFQAHNAEFEYAVWEYCVRRLWPDAPPIHAGRYICTAARCRAAGLPGSLDGVGRALNLPVQKDKEGSRLLNMFSKMQAARKARKPSKNNPNPVGVPERRIYPWDEPEEFNKLISYNVTDVVAEMMIPPVVPALPPKEQRIYTLTLEMNRRGLPLDMPAVDASMPTLTELEKRVERRVLEITGGIKPTQRDKMLEIFADLGEELENLQAKTLKDILTIRGDELSDELRELMQLRLEGGKASTKKLKKMLQIVTPWDGRVRGGFMFYGAHTGRYSGKGMQPQNFTRGEYNPEQLENLFWFLKHCDADVFEMLWHRPIDAIAQGMRGYIKAAKGKKFVVSDFAAIEARVLAWLADEKEMLKVYARNGDVYITMASALYKRDENELLRLKAVGDKVTMGQRKFAKDVVLGCFAADTKVLTKTGAKLIVDVTADDYLWDGVEWVRSMGTAYMGEREVIDICGVKVTPEHEIHTGQQWHPASALVQSTQLLNSALVTGALPLSLTWLASVEDSYLTCADATAVPKPTLVFGASKKGGPLPVVHALDAKPASHVSIPVSAESCPSQFSAACTAATESLPANETAVGRGSIPANALPAASGTQTLGGSSRVPAAQPASDVSTSGAACRVSTQSTSTCTPGSQTCTGDACPTRASEADTLATKVSPCAGDGTTSQSSLSIASDCPATSPDLTTSKSTASITTGTTNQETAGSSQAPKTSQTVKVYDVIECGPRNRFTILTDSGPLLVHNCGFQMGGAGFYRNCIMRGIKVEEKFCMDAVKTYRKEVPNIVKLWYDVEECAIAAVVQRATRRNPIVLRKLTFYMEGRWLCIGLPSGRAIRYIDPKVQLVERFGKMRNQLSFKTEYKGKWIRETTYGGKLAENVTQAVARDIMVESMVRANKRGYYIIATIHDELVCEVDEDFGSAKELEDLMSELPKWAVGAPVSCEGWEGPRYRK